MSRKLLVLTVTAIVAAALGAGLAAAGSAGKRSTPTVRMMVGGIDKQIYLPYQLAQNLGFYKKYGVNVQLSTEQSGGVGAEDALASGQVEFAGAWYIHTIDFQQQGKAVIGVVQLSGAPGEREVCANGAGINSPKQFNGKSLGVTDLGSGTDELTQYMAAHAGIPVSSIHRVAVGSGATLIAALQHHTVDCAMTTQPTVAAVVKNGFGYSAIDLATVKGVNANLGGYWPAASVLARADWVKGHPQTTQRLVNAMVATMHWIDTHTAAQIAAHMPKDYVENSLITRADYVKALAQDKGQFLPDGLMPKGGPAKVLDVERVAGLLKHSVNLPATYTNKFAIKANKLEGFKRK